MIYIFSSAATLAVLTFIAVASLVPGGAPEWWSAFSRRVFGYGTTDTSGLLISFVQLNSSGDDTALRLSPEVFFGVSFFMPFWNLLILFLLSWCVCSLLRQRRLLSLTLLLTALWKVQAIIYDYGYLVTILPALWFFLNTNEKHEGKRSALNPSGTLLCILSAYGLVIPINAVESIYFSSYHKQLAELHHMLEGVIEQSKTESGTPSVGFFYSLDQDFRVLASASERFIRLGYNQETSFSSGKVCLNDITREYLAKKEFVLQMVIMPRGHVSCKDLHIDGVKFNLLKSISFGEAQRICNLWHDRPIGYPVDVFVREIL